MDSTRNALFRRIGEGGEITTHSAKEFFGKEKDWPEAQRQDAGNLVPHPLLPIGVPAPAAEAAAEPAAPAPSLPNGSGEGQAEGGATIVHQPGADRAAGEQE